MGFGNDLQARRAELGAKHFGGKHGKVKAAALLTNEPCAAIRARYGQHCNIPLSASPGKKANSAPS